MYWCVDNIRIVIDNGCSRIILKFNRSAFKSYLTFKKKKKIRICISVKFIGKCKLFVTIYIYGKYVLITLKISDGINPKNIN